MFNHSLSHQLDALIYLIEHENRRFVRWVLRCYKATLESRVRP
jgi:hypothetical protein